MRRRAACRASSPGSRSARRAFRLRLVDCNRDLTLVPTMKSAIQSPDAPAAIGTYSQAVRAGDTVYLSGQIGLDPATMQLVDGIEAQIDRVLRNLSAVAAAAGLGLEHAV